MMMNTMQANKCENSGARQLVYSCKRQLGLCICITVTTESNNIDLLITKHEKFWTSGKRTQIQKFRNCNIGSELQSLVASLSSLGRQFNAAVSRKQCLNFYPVRIPVHPCVVFVHQLISHVFLEWPRYLKHCSVHYTQCVCVCCVCQREHNDLLLKLEFVRDLSSSVIQIARTRSSPLAESVFADDAMCCAGPPSTSAAVAPTSDACSTVFVSEGQRRMEQLVLYMRALELLASALNLAKAALADGRLSLTTLTRQGSATPLSLLKKICA